MRVATVFVCILLSSARNIGKVSGNTRQRAFYSQLPSREYQQPSPFLSRYPQDRFLPQSPRRYRERHPVLYSEQGYPISYRPRYEWRQAVTQRTYLPIRLAPRAPQGGDSSSGGFDVEGLSFALILSILASSRAASTTESTTLATTTQPPTTTISPATTTTMKLTTTTVPTTTETTTTTTTTTPGPFADWIRYGTCLYIRPPFQLTWMASQQHCNGLIDGADLISAGFNQPANKRMELIGLLGLSSLSYWVGARGTGNGNEGDPTTGTEWILTGDPADAPANLGVENGDDTNGGICGRFYAGNNPTTLYFEDCSDQTFYFVCEYCGTIN